MTEQDQMRQRVPTFVIAVPPLAVRVAAAAVVLGAGHSAVAQQSEVDKSDYNLFNPTGISNVCK